MNTKGVCASMQKENVIVLTITGYLDYWQFGDNENKFGRSANEFGQISN